MGLLHHDLLLLLLLLGHALMLHTGLVRFGGVNSHGLLFLVFVITCQHCVLSGLFSDLFECLLDFLGPEADLVQLILVLFVKIVAVFAHRPLLRA